MVLAAPVAIGEIFNTRQFLEALSPQHFSLEAAAIAIRLVTSCAPRKNRPRGGTF